MAICVQAVSGVMFPVSSLWKRGGGIRIGQRRKLSSEAIPTKNSAGHMESSEAGMAPLRRPQQGQEDQVFIPHG